MIQNKVFGSCLAKQPVISYKARNDPRFIQNQLFEDQVFIFFLPSHTWEKIFAQPEITSFADCAKLLLLSVKDNIIRRYYNDNSYAFKWILRLSQVLNLIPVSKSVWWEGCKTGRFPGVELSGSKTR